MRRTRKVGHVIILAGSFKIDVGKADVAMPAIAKMMNATAGEPGCTTSIFSADLVDPGLMHLFNLYESEEALQAHFVAPHLMEFRKGMDDWGFHDSAVLLKYVVSEYGPAR